MKILIAEDDPISSLLVQRALVGIRHEVIVAENGKQALADFSGAGT